MEMLTKEMVGDEDIAKAKEPKYDYSDENLTNLPPRVLEGYLAEKYGTDRYVRERSSVFEEASQNKISDRESILTGPELEALSLVFEEQIKQMKAKAKGGMAEQMEMFQEGGLKDEGGTVDPVSGNEVPPGSTQEEVRDDIPAQLSEGEFVFPADVVRYLGLEFLMKLRQRAKAGLQKMEEMGQMGNSDEATLPDDIPFTVDDLDMREETEEEMEMYQGGAVKAQAGMYVAPSIAPVRAGTTTTTQPFMTQPAVAQTNMAFQQPPVAQVNPNLTFANFLGPSAGGAPETEIRRYEHPDGRVRNITVVKATGLPLIPGELDKAKADGFDFKPEALKEEVKVEPIKQQTSRVQSTLSDGDGGPEPTTSAVDPAGDPLSYSSIFDMDNLDKQMSKIGAMQLSILGKPGISQGVFSAITGTPERNQMKLGAITPTFTSLKEKLGLKGKDLVNATKEQRNVIAAEVERVSAAIDRLTTNIEFSKDEKGNTISTESNKSTQDVIDEVNAMADKYGLDKIDTKSNINLSSKIGKKVAEINKAIQQQPTYSEDPSDTIESLDPTAGDVYSDETQTTTPQEQAANIAAAQSFMDSNDNNDNTSSDPEGVMGGEEVAKGSLITKRKASGKVKKKYMKKGGLASKK